MMNMLKQHKVLSYLWGIPSAHNSVVKLCGDNLRAFIRQPELAIYFKILTQEVICFDKERGNSANFAVPTT
jgi:hypothetical protein